MKAMKAMKAANVGMSSSWRRKSQGFFDGTDVEKDVAMKAMKASKAMKTMKTMKTMKAMKAMKAMKTMKAMKARTAKTTVKTYQIDSNVLEFMAHLAKYNRY